MQVTTIGLDIAKNVFQVHGIDADEKVVVQAAPLTDWVVISVCKIRWPIHWSSNIVWTIFAWPGDAWNCPGVSGSR